jgi:hypothetical protein
VVGDGDGFFDVVMGRVDVKQSAMLQASSATASFLLGNIAMGLVEKL